MDNNCCFGCRNLQTQELVAKGVVEYECRAFGKKLCEHPVSPMPILDNCYSPATETESTVTPFIWQLIWILDGEITQMRTYMDYHTATDAFEWHVKASGIIKPNGKNARIEMWELHPGIKNKKIAFKTISTKG